MTDQIYTARLDNNLTVLGERMPWLESAAFTLALPAGCARDPDEKAGLANFTCEMVQRGCGQRSSRQFVEDLDYAGIDRSASVSISHTSFGAAMPATQLEGALEIYADVIQRPHIPKDQIEDGRHVCFQEIHSLEDDLPQRMFGALRTRHYPAPYGRQAEGNYDSVESITRDDIQAFFDNTYRPDEAILSVAGNIDWDDILEIAERYFGQWGSAPPPAIPQTEPPGGYQHILHQSHQTHIGVACPSVPFSDPNYYQARGAVGILSDGMSSRLFTEVREKRALCYSVSASCHSLKDRGSVLCYSGTTPERAQETLDVLIAELERLSEGVTQAELDRLKARIKSSLIMQQESSVSRSSQMAASWYFLQRVQTLHELSRIVDGLSCDSINQYLRAHPLKDFTIVTLGPDTLEIPNGVSSAQAE